MYPQEATSVNEFLGHAWAKISWTRLLVLCPHGKKWSLNHGLLYLMNFKLDLILMLVSYGFRYTRFLGKVSLLILMTIVRPPCRAWRSLFRLPALENSESVFNLSPPSMATSALPLVSDHI